MKSLSASTKCEYVLSSIEFSFSVPISFSMGEPLRESLGES
jgi:hypothetical protein